MVSFALLKGCFSKCSSLKLLLEHDIDKTYFILAHIYVNIYVMICYGYSASMSVTVLAAVAAYII
jgi:hypothetical protein